MVIIVIQRAMVKLTTGLESDCVLQNQTQTLNLHRVEKEAGNKGRLTS